ncbi:MAG: DUF116 domain-containing protein [Fusobacteriaceae bacterium]|nr:DUF116 domain-containing protein [Fusobacteriaceae bacterium]
MIKDFLIKMLYRCYYARYLLSEMGKSDRHKEWSTVAEGFVAFNNKRVLRKYRNGKVSPDRILILLPHCLQSSFCPLRITTEIRNCKNCGKCVIGRLQQLSDTYKVSTKVATGGTLARKYIKEIKAKLVIAVACKRDLISGICDTIPAVDVYGIFNEIVNEPCLDTTVSAEKIEAVLAMVCQN